MLHSISMSEILVILIIGGFYPVAIFYILSLQRALERCAPASRSMPPVMAWLLLVPGFGWIWHFLIVIHMSKSLDSEFRLRSIPDFDPVALRELGLAACILPLGVTLSVLAPWAGLFALVAGLVCWVVYWMKITKYASELA